MKKTVVALLAVFTMAALMFWAAGADARSGWFTGATTPSPVGQCNSCHVNQTGSSFCGMCHAHGTHPNSSKNTMNVTATPDKATYTAGEAMSVTISGGYRPSQARAVVFDGLNPTTAVQKAISTGTYGVGDLAPTNAPAWTGSGPASIVLSGFTAPTVAGTYTWYGAWYGNQYDLGTIGGTTTFGAWTADPGNPQHGWEMAAFNFTVTAATAPIATVSPMTVAFSNVPVGSTSQRSVELTNTGTADLTVASMAYTGIDAGSFSVTPGGVIPCSSLTPALAPNQSCTVIVGFQATVVGTKAATLRVNSNATNSPTDIPTSGAAVAPTAQIFNDVAPTYWAANYIDNTYFSGITTGCTQNPLNYCPLDNVTRQAMAAFIIRALEGEPPSNYCDAGSPFADVPTTSQFCKYIKRMKELNITTGCNPPANTNYCPGTAVNRQAMAAFIIRALHGETFTYTQTPFFTDVPATSPFFKYVQKMKDDGITTGCTATEYCPANLVNRAQMSAFLDRAFLGMP
jgi:hypothetical protein